MASMESLAATKALYESQGDLRSLRTTLVAVTSVKALSEAEQKLFKQALPEDLVFTTEETIFHAQGGGQPSDTGHMLVYADPEGDSQVASFQVQSVRRTANGTILHRGRLEPPEATVRVDSHVEQHVDGDSRDLFSRIHTGGHVLGLAVRQLGSKIPSVVETKAQHYPDAAFVEFQGKIEAHHSESIQEVLDDLVQQDLPVTVSWLDTVSLQEKGIHLANNFSRESAPESTRVVEIGELGGYPCGGTHCHSTSKLGRVVVGKISNRKGNTQIRYTVT
ncbi:ThrRS/AlaRS common domain-containing protein [Xylaria bambusicola]|uniref:ThrRS/AlaRS common domain-containing protein n=1 Tax=Xylaria bambusicola TaxID=326684 RepID=UPI0020089A50|nr:ThrRS/AlaRS common domain-containing protein [Xylaria bambusicola]KAI0521399.1 ThrRS/AlaRS common domain-containing protein [Xylaria bambusicola]